MPRPSARLRCEPLEDRTTPAAPPAPGLSVLPVPGPTITVTTAADVVDANDGLTSLREAIAESQVVPSADAQYPGTSVIKFADALAGATVTVSQIGGTSVGPAAFEISRSVSIEGSGQKVVRAAAPHFRFFTVLADPDAQQYGGLSLSKLELRGGYSDGAGGAIYLRGGSVTLNSALLAEHSAAGQGGAVYSDGGYVSVSNSTLANNTARGTSSSGGAVYASGGGSVNLNYATLAGNTAASGAQANATGTYLFLSNSILYTAGAVGADLVVANSLDPTYVYGKNVIGKAEGMPGEFITADPKLGPLQDNGGPTRTMLPQPGSPAIDAGDADLNAASPRDQRGFVRGVGRKADLGAAEVGATPTGVEYTPPSLVVGSAAGSAPEVRVLRGDGTEAKRFLAYGPDFRGGVRVAMADLTGDGIPDIITAAGAGGGPHVKVFDGYTYQEIRSFYAFDAGFTGGVSLAVGDISGDGTMDIVVGAGAGGGPHVRVLDGKTNAEVKSFFAFDPKFAGGVSVATAGDGYQPALVVAAGPGGGPHVRVLDAQTLAEQLSFYAYDPTFAGGVNVTYASGQIFTGTVSGAPHVKAFRDTRYSGRGMGLVPPEVASFYAGDPAATTGVTLGGAAAPLWPPPEYPYYYGSGSTGSPSLFTSVGTGTLARYTIAYDDDYTDPTNPKLHTKVEPQPLETPVSGGFAGIGGLPQRYNPIIAAATPTTPAE